DGESYWENVRSVMGLLTSTFVDASSRLEEALEETAKMKMADEIPSGSDSPDSRDDPLHAKKPPPPPPPQQQRQRSGASPMMSFAPMPSHLSRFAAHVNTISTALNDARDYLEECMASLKDASVGGEEDSFSPPVVPLHEAPSLRAFERL